MVRSTYTDTVTRLRAPLKPSSHGGTTFDWGNAAKVALAGVRVQALNSVERDGRTDITHRLLGPLDLDLTNSDRVIVRDPRGADLTMQVTGHPRWHRGITGAVAHAEYELKAVDA